VVSNLCARYSGTSTRPNYKARSDEIWDKGLAIFHILTNLNYHSTLYVGTSVLWWARWATVTYRSVGKLKMRVGNGKKISALCAEFYKTNVCPPWPEILPAPPQDSVFLQAKWPSCRPTNSIKALKAQMCNMHEGIKLKCLTYNVKTQKATGC